jgi:putative peptidoglycan lipid II flippase
MSDQAIGIPLAAAQADLAAPSPALSSRPATRSTGFVGHAKLISVLTLCSRILGMLRESVMANYFGATAVAQAFTVAFAVPNLFRKLLGEGALSAAFIPLYASALKSGDEKEAQRFAAASLNMLATLLVALTLIGELVLWLLPHLIHFRSDNLLVVRFTAIMLPYVILVCGTAFLSGILQVHKRFALPALTQVPLNVMHVVVIITGARLLMLKPGIANEQLQIHLAYWLSFFVLIAGCLQITMLMPALRLTGFRPMWIGNFWTPAVRKLLKLSLPVAFSAGVLQISVLLDKGITLFLTQGENPTEKLHLFGRAFNYPMVLGAAARLNWAQMLYQFPLGVFAIAVATAIFPSLSADAHDRDGEKFKRVLRQGILFTLLEGFPASIGLILVRYPAIRLLFQHGSFTAHDTQLMELSVLFYSAAIWAFSMQQILNRAYYALHDTVTPLVLSIVTISVNTVVEIPLSFTKLGESGMAAGTVASFAIQAIVMLIMLDRKVGGIGLKSIASAAARMLTACAAMCAACWVIQKLSFYPTTTNHLASLEQLAILMIVGGATYGGVCWALGVRMTGMLSPKAPPAQPTPPPSESSPTQS